MPNQHPFTRKHHLIFIALFLLSIPLKLYAANDLAWEMDFVPVLARGGAFLDEGIFPAYGTLSSVAAYNLPFLVWMHLPVLIFTRDVAAALIITGLAFNLLGTWAVYRLGGEMFSPTIGLVAAALFTFNETSISSSYTAWAQLHLPMFYAVVFLCLWRWKSTGKAQYIALAIISVTAAFMTHFSAVLLYPTAIFYILIARPPIKWRGFAIGIIIAALMGAPYLFFQIERDFVDLRAFLTRETLVPQDILDSYADLKPGASHREPYDNDQTDAKSDLLPYNKPLFQNDTPTRTQRIIVWIISIPGQYADGLMLAFNDTPDTITANSPLLGRIAASFMRDLLRLLFIVGTIFALYRVGMEIRQNGLQGYDLTNSQWGRYTLLLLFILVIISGMIVTRASPDSQPTYYTGFLSLQLILVAQILVHLLQTVGAVREPPSYQIVRRNIIALIVIIIIAFSATDRILRVSQHDYDRYSIFNVWVYRNMDAAVDYIADDWQGGDNITISYDLFPEMAHFWWVAPWNSIDPLYGIGMSYDYLLRHEHGLLNTNDNPVGIADNPDYIITYEPALISYNLEDYAVEKFGAIYVLEPN